MLRNCLIKNVSIYFHYKTFCQIKIFPALISFLFLISCSQISKPFHLSWLLVNFISAAIICKIIFFRGIVWQYTLLIFLPLPLLDISRLLSSLCQISLTYILYGSLFRLYAFECLICQYTLTQIININTITCGIAYSCYMFMQMWKEQISHKNVFWTFLKQIKNDGWRHWPTFYKNLKVRDC